MRPGRHAAGGGASTAGRGIVLLAIALLLGVVLLNATDPEPPGERVVAGGAQEEEEQAEEEPSASTVPPTTTTTAAARAPKDVKVVVANASSTKGAAGKVSDLLKPPGYNVLSPTNAPSAPSSSIFFVAGFERDAAALAQVLQLPANTLKPMPTPPPIPDLRGANVLVVVGPELAARVTGATTTTAKPAGGSTATTAKSTGASTTTTAPGSTTTVQPTTSTTRRP